MKARTSRSFTLLAITLFLAVPSGYAQESDDDLGFSAFTQASIPSPEVYSALKMEDYTTVSNTGGGTLAVPLYTLQAEGLSTPVALTYDHGGIRAEEKASPAGLGWRVSTGASLTRVVVGIPDEERLGVMRKPERTKLMAELIDPTVTDPRQGTAEYSNLYNAARLEGYDDGADAFK